MGGVNPNLYWFVYHVDLKKVEMSPVHGIKRRWGSCAKAKESVVGYSPLGAEGYFWGSTALRFSRKLRNQKRKL